MALDQNSTITGYNIDYLKNQFDRFIYIDRIAVHPKRQNQGIGRGLYQALTKFAVCQNAPRLLCEINVDPPNQDSHQFHRRLGFEPFECPRRLPSGKKV